MHRRNVRRLLLVGFAGLFLLHGSARPAPADPPPRGGARTDALLGRLLRSYRPAGPAAGRAAGAGELSFLSEMLLVDRNASPPTVRVWMRLAADRAEKAAEAAAGLGARFHGRVGALRSATVPLPSLAAVVATPGIEWVHAVRRARKELDVSVPDVGADTASGTYGARGAGVILGFADTGIDASHEDFRNPDGTTRIVALWDQTDPSVICTQPSFGYGCVYTTAEIDNALMGIGTIPGDPDGHGTAVAGIAGGDGSQTGNGEPAFVFNGIAPEADLVVVKVLATPGSAGADGDIGDAVAFIDETATTLGKPWVANVSLGFDHGGHDGSDPIEIVFDTLTGPAIPGKAVVKSAGNTRGWGIHESGTVSTGTFTDHSFTIPAYTPNPGIFDDVQAFNLWYSAGDALTVTAFGPMGTVVSGSTGDGFAGFITDDGVIIIDDTDSPSPLGDRFFEVEIDDQCSVNPGAACGFTFSPAPTSGTWTIRVTGDSVTAGGRYDMWIWFSQLGTNFDFADWATPDFSMLGTIPGTAVQATTVGAYFTKIDWTNIDGGTTFYPGAPPAGSLTDFSAPGPTRDNRLKPEIAAPGQGIATALSFDAAPGVLANPNERILVVEDGVHWVLAGSSFAAPHVSGAYALMLGLNPDLDATQLRAMVQETARTDSFTGMGLPDDDWGHGKLDVQAALDMVVKPIDDVTAFQSGTTASFTWSIIPQATHYNGYRGLISQLDGSFYGTCGFQMQAIPAVSDPAIPPPGDGFFYLATGTKDGVEGLLGFRSDGGIRPNLNPCM